jgi:hypothetical protein
MSEPISKRNLTSSRRSFRKRGQPSKRQVPLPPSRVGTRCITVHAANDVYLEVHDLAADERLTIDEALHLAMALLLKRGGRALPSSLDEKLKERRLTAYLVTSPAP